MDYASTTSVFAQMSIKSGQHSKKSIAANVHANSRSEPLAGSQIPAKLNDKKQKISDRERNRLMHSTRSDHPPSRNSLLHKSPTEIHF
jgi:hypothetical protein